MCNIKHRNSWGIESENLGKGKGKGGMKGEVVEPLYMSS